MIALLIFAMFIAGGLVGFYIFCYYTSNIEDKSIELFGLEFGTPIIKVKHNDKEFNFLVDSGSSCSHIAATHADLLKGEKFEEKNEICGLGDPGFYNDWIKVNLEILGVNCETNLCINKTIVEPLKFTKELTKIETHGILGTDFMIKYAPVLNLDEKLLSLKGTKVK